jgi:hypothetical protein
MYVTMYVCATGTNIGRNAPLLQLSSAISAAVVHIEQHRFHSHSRPVPTNEGAHPPRHHSESMAHGRRRWRLHGMAIVVANHRVQRVVCQTACVCSQIMGGDRLLSSVRFVSKTKYVNKVDYQFVIDTSLAAKQAELRGRSLARSLGGRICVRRRREPRVSSLPCSPPRRRRLRPRSRLLLGALQLQRQTYAA